MYLCSIFVLGFIKWFRTFLILLELLVDIVIYFIYFDYIVIVFFFYIDIVGVGFFLEEDEG